MSGLRWFKVCGVCDAKKKSDIKNSSDWAEKTEGDRGAHEGKIEDHPQVPRQRLAIVCAVGGMLDL